MLTENFLKGLVMGFCIAAPVGPIGLLCIRRSITDGRLAGFVSGLGAATADALYGLIAALGLTTVTHFLVDHRTSIQLGGGLFLIYIGVTLVRARPAATTAGPVHARSLATAYASTCVLTLANPVTILSFVGIFAGLGIGVNTGGVAPAAVLVAGVFLGSAGWWLLLSNGANWLGSKVGTHRLHMINLVSGGLIIAFAVWQLVSLLT